MSSATVTIPYEQMKQMEAAVEKAKIDVARLSEELDDAKLAQGDGTGRAYRDAFLAILPVVQFAIANMNPMTFRGWPYQAIFDLCLLMPELPKLPPVIAEIQNDLRLFARECKKWEDARAHGVEQKLLAEENERWQGPGPDPVGPRAVRQAMLLRGDPGAEG